MKKSLDDLSDADLRAELERRKKARGPMKISTPKGRWKITTEGDCEGRSIKDVAVDEGHIGNVLLRYGKAAMYGLTAERIDVQQFPEGESADEAIVYASSFLEQYSSPLTNSELDLIQKFLGPEFAVSPAQYYASFMLRRKK